MARPRKVQETTTEAITKAINPQDKPERFQIGEVGYVGLSLFGGVTTDEIHRELSWPNSIKTFKQMQTHSSINACLTLYDNLISKVTWRVVPPQDATEEEKQQTEFVNECLNDMDISFRQVIRDALSSNTYGFAVLEKVYRRRNKSSGSLYTDNKIGVKKISLRNQETIQKFIFDDSGNEVIGVKQVVYNSDRTPKQKQEIVLPRSKFVLITTGKNRSDPYGKSPLRDVYMAWRYLEVLQELEAQGVQKDLQGVPMLRVPAQLMSADASPDQKAIFENLKNIVRNLQVNQQSGVILPSAVDEVTRTPLFDLSLLSTEGGKKNYDVSEIKQYYQNQIFTSMFADILILGSTGVGSFALGTLKTTLTGAAVETMLDNIVDAFNRDLVRQLYDLNGWNAARACRLDYEGLHSADLETISKFVQRVSSTGNWLQDQEAYNFIRKTVGLDPITDESKIEELVSASTTRAGDGMAKGSGNGTSDSVAGTDTSANNADNTA